MRRSRLSVEPDGAIALHLSTSARWLAVHAARTRVIAAGDVVGMWRSDSRSVGRRLRWKIAGTALSRQRAMGWFSWIGHRGRWAWIWLTPGRQVVVVETRLRRPALLVVPLDWLESSQGEGIHLEPWNVC
ncbi:MAG: hypothetical protein ACO3QI_07425 [Ilumatobacteraceae bacterium]